MAKSLNIPRVYQSTLNLIQTEMAIKQVKDHFERNLSGVLNLDRFPDLTPKQREDAIAKELGAVFIVKIGGKLLSGEKHDGRSPDYDDWNLNGDIVYGILS